MQNRMQVFKNSEFGEIRTLEINDEPYFVGKDVAEALGYSNPQKALRDHIDREDKTLNESFTVNGTQGILINESGLYSLILSSKLDSAKRFKRWVTSEVLPSIRKTGGYVNDDDMFVKTYLPFADEHTQAMFRSTLENIRMLNAKIERDKPKVLFADAVETADTSILVGDLAKLIKQNGIDIGQKRLFNWLRERGYLVKSGNSRNMPTQKSMELKLFEVKERTISNPDGSVRITKTTKVTGKGQQYFINKFLAPTA